MAINNNLWFMQMGKEQNHCPQTIEGISSMQYWNTTQCKFTRQMIGRGTIKKDQTLCSLPGLWYIGTALRPILQAPSCHGIVNNVVCTDFLYAFAKELAFRLVTYLRQNCIAYFGEWQHFLPRKGIQKFMRRMYIKINCIPHCKDVSRAVSTEESRFFYIHFQLENR